MKLPEKVILAFPQDYAEFIEDEGYDYEEVIDEHTEQILEKKFGAIADSFEYEIAEGAQISVIVTDIEWFDLPTKLQINIMEEYEESGAEDDGISIREFAVDELANILSDQYGFLIESLNFDIDKFGEATVTNIVWDTKE